jgi:hypothetical protein
MSRLPWQLREDQTAPKRTPYWLRARDLLVESKHLALMRKYAMALVAKRKIDN